VRALTEHAVLSDVAHHAREIEPMQIAQGRFAHVGWHKRAMVNASTQAPSRKANARCLPSSTKPCRV